MMIKPRLNSITRLARAGALEQAWSLFDASGYLASCPDDTDVLTVHGRLLKDRAAREEGEARERLLNDAIHAYERASHLSRATYPLINAATLAFLAGRREHARRLAAETLLLLDSGDYAPETPFWLDATRAEALLLLGRVGEADGMLGRAIGHQPEAWEDHASTLRQFAMIMQETGVSAGWLDRYRPPPAMHFEGILGIAADDAAARERIEERIAGLAPGYAVGALAAGADILVAEAVIRNGGYLHAVLPCPPDLFRQTSLRPFGPDWEDRFDRLMDEAASVLILDDWQPLSNASIDIAREAAMGLAIRESRRLQSAACALRVRVESEGGTLRGDDYWEGLGLPVHRIWIERSYGSRMALPDPGRALALISLPEALKREAGQAGAVTVLDDQDGLVALAFGSLVDAARFACSIVRRHPDARIGLDYRAQTGSEEGDPVWTRVQAMASADPAGAVTLSEPAALALALQWPDVNVQPMGNVRVSVGDMPVYGLFPDRGSDDKLGQ